MGTQKDNLSPEPVRTDSPVDPCQPASASGVSGTVTAYSILMNEAVRAPRQS